jgi:hypothetical protein
VPHLSRHALDSVGVFALGELLIRYVKNHKNGYRQQQSFHRNPPRGG